MSLDALMGFFTSLFCGLFGTCQTDACRVETFHGVKHTVCSYAVSDILVRMHLNDETGKPYARPARLPKDDGDGRALLMAMNGGMYHHDLGPVGLYVEEGARKKRLTTKGGYGNFHLLPNGVFWGRQGKLHITESRRFKSLGVTPDFATQSGPMLLINGKRHPRFLKDSNSRKIRNGVGISRDGTRVHFAISHREVTFWDFADLFSNSLNAHNALFLDGTVSTMWAKGHSIPRWRSVGPMIGVYER